MINLIWLVVGIGLGYIGRIILQSVLMVYAFARALKRFDKWAARPR